MARTIDQITQTMQDQYVLLRAQYGLPYDDPTQWSNLNIKRLIVGVMAFCHWLLETLFDTTAADNLAALATKKPHTERWYAAQALLYQYGFPTTADGSGFDNTGYSDGEVTDSLIVSYAAVTEQEDVSGRIYLRMKLAHDNGLDLEPLDSNQVDSFKTWFNSTQKDAGVKLQIDSLPPDSLVQNWTIYYDPLILSSTGSRLDGQDSTPVQDTIKSYLKNLPFNGLYVPQYHEDMVELVQGVVIGKLVSCQARYGSLPYADVFNIYTPDAGYLRFLQDSDLSITFIAQTAIK